MWAAAGGTQVSIVTMRLGLDSAAAHIDHLVAVKAGLDERFGT